MSAPERIAHPYNGPDLPTEVYADPGRNGWYFREKMPDSVARFVRAGPSPVPDIEALVDAMNALLDAPKGTVPDAAAPFYDAVAGRFSVAAQKGGAT